MNIEIKLDQHPLNPRDEWDNATTMVAFHKRYNLGDKHEYRSSQFSSWDELERQIIKDHKPVVIKPLFLLDHSGITIRTTPFDDPWDSGQIGFVFMTPAQVRDIFGVKRITRKVKERAEAILESEVAVYDAYLSGEVYGYEITDDEGYITDSCWGFYGRDSVEAAVRELQQ